MTIVRTNPATWGSGDPITSAQINGLDINTTNALDKVSGHTDTLGSIVMATGQGRIIPSSHVGLDANTTYSLSSNGASFIWSAVGTLTANRVYSLSGTGAANGDTVTIQNLSTTFTITVMDASSSATLGVLGLNTVLPDADAVTMEFIFIGATWTNLNHSRQPRQSSQTFLTSGTFVVPRGVSLLQLDMAGGGGGGGGGSGATVITPFSVQYVGGGAGGGSAMPLNRMVFVTPGTSLTVTVGAGGSGGSSGAGGTGAGASVGGNGADGNDSIVANGGTVLAATPGAQGGSGGINISVSTSPKGLMMPGGGPNRNSPRHPTLWLPANGPMTVQYSPGFGGPGTAMVDNGTTAGFVAPAGNAASGSGGGPGSLGGTSPAWVSGSFGNGGSGGGGAGGFLEGATPTRAGTGGTGGTFSGSYIPAVAGGAAPANSGGGGGGGGGGSGDGSTTGYSGAIGGGGGSGWVTIKWVK